MHDHLKTAMLGGRTTIVPAIQHGCHPTWLPSRDHAKPLVKRAGGTEGVYIIEGKVCTIWQN
jgi:hypothetical protein